MVRNFFGCYCLLDPNSQTADTYRIGFRIAKIKLSDLCDATTRRLKYWYLTSCFLIKAYRVSGKLRVGREGCYGLSQLRLSKVKRQICYLSVKGWLVIRTYGDGQGMEEGSRLQTQRGWNWQRCKRFNMFMKMYWPSVPLIWFVFLTVNF